MLQLLLFDARLCCVLMNAKQSPFFSKKTTREKAGKFMHDLFLSVCSCLMGKLDRERYDQPFCDQRVLQAQCFWVLRYVKAAPTSKAMPSGSWSEASSASSASEPPASTFLKERSMSRISTGTASASTFKDLTLVPYIYNHLVPSILGVRADDTCYVYLHQDSCAS